MKLVAVKEQYPPPHERYMVQRGQHEFVATPCYGLHLPWWVPMGPDGEGEPVNFQKDDQWVPVSEIVREADK